MTPEELSALHPRLFHLTAPEAVVRIREEGLLSAAAIVEREGADPALLARRRPAEVRVGPYTINDNLPLAENVLAGVLDDGLRPADWLRMLNGRVFFWADEKRLARLRGANTNRDRSRAVLVVDTLSLARAHAKRMEICPINSGATGRSPARRGRLTFASLPDVDYDAWRRRRPTKSLDRIAEVTVRDGVPDVFDHVVEVRDV